MRLKFPWKPLGRILLWAIPLSAPFFLAGCGQTACITWSKAEGVCPSQDEALMFFQNPACPSSVVSVDSEGAFANDLCCYEVSKLENGFGTGDSTCFGGGGEGGFGGTGAVATVTSGGPPPVSGCLRCAQLIEDQGPSSAQICPQSEELFDLVKSCMCAGECATACSDNFCQFSPASSACLGCVADTTTECGLAFEKCASDADS
jgi:hypothetical protein